MGESREIWRAVRAQRQKENQRRGDRNMEQLRDAIAADSRISLFDTGHHYIVSFQKRRVMYWPQTGAMTPRFGKDRTSRTMSGNQLVAFITTP